MILQALRIYQQAEFNPFNLDVMGSVSFNTNLFLMPLTVLVVGAFIGTFAKRRVWLLAGTSIAPFLGVCVAGRVWTVEAIFLGVFYLSLGISASAVIFRWRKKHGS